MPSEGYLPTAVLYSKYNEKELDTKKGLNWYDYGARNYDAAIGRFMTVDPMAEKYYGVSPYTYCENDPIKFVDPSGMMKVIYNQDGTYKETTHKNWFHNTFFGRQEYIDYGNNKVQLSEQEFWDWQKTGNYASIKPTDNITNLEFYLDEPATGLVDGATKFLLSTAYSIVNSPKTLLTGRTLSGASQTSTERIGSFIDMASTYIPFSKIGKVGNPGSWYKFKKANKHIPTSKRKSVYEMEMRTYKEKTKATKAFENLQEPLDILFYSKEKQEKD